MPNPEPTPRGLVWWYTLPGRKMEFKRFSISCGWRQWFWNPSARGPKDLTVIVPGKTYLLANGNLQLFLPPGVRPEDV